MTQLDRQYPVGTLADALAGASDYQADVAEIAGFAERLIALLAGLSPKQLTQHYRPGSWTIPILVHHCADSHMHALLRSKKALTESVPEIGPYDEGLTATLADYTLPMEVSVQMLTGIHARFATLLASLSPAQQEREYLHLGHGRTFTVADIARTYAWHGRHHLEHIRLAAFDPA